MRRFQLVRYEDETGVSGTGIVADGVKFDNGKTVLQWRGEHRSIVVWDDMASVAVVHGHHGKTAIVWLDN